MPDSTALAACAFLPLWDPTPATKTRPSRGRHPVHSLVEHTSINPNKAAHIGHLRNAILGDTFVRLLRAIGQKVDVQNYIDNTGVQVADIVVGLIHLENKSVANVRALIAESDNARRTANGSTTTVGICMRALRNGTSRVSEEENVARRQLRYATLHEIEPGGNETAEIAELISTAVLKRHLERCCASTSSMISFPRK